LKAVNTDFAKDWEMVVAVVAKGIDETDILRKTLDEDTGGQDPSAIVCGTFIERKKKNTQKPYEKNFSAPWRISA
jgi:hypothetical protein